METNNKSRKVFDAETQDEFRDLLKKQLETFNLTAHDNHNENNTNQHDSTLQNFILDLIVERPKLFDDSARAEVVDFYKRRHAKINRLLDMKNLYRLSESKFQNLSWIVFEALLINLIKNQVYEPKVIASEMMNIVKRDVEPVLSSKLATLLKSCVPYCRQSGAHSVDEEEEEKWCEIIDWLSWAITDEDGQL